MSWIFICVFRLMALNRGVIRLFLNFYMLRYGQLIEFLLNINQLWNRLCCKKTWIEIHCQLSKPPGFLILHRQYVFQYYWNLFSDTIRILFLLIWKFWITCIDLVNLNKMLPDIAKEIPSATNIVQRMSQRICHVKCYVYLSVDSNFVFKIHLLYMCYYIIYYILFS